jgi:hypothetical protein
MNNPIYLKPSGDHIDSIQAWAEFYPAQFPRIYTEREIPGRIQEQTLHLVVAVNMLSPFEDLEKCADSETSYRSYGLSRIFAEAAMLHAVNESSLLASLNDQSYSNFSTFSHAQHRLPKRANPTRFREYAENMIGDTALIANRALKGTETGHKNIGALMGELTYDLLGAASASGLFVFSQALDSFSVDAWKVGRK